MVDEIRTMKRILILGGGFAGVECCLDLESYFKNNKDVEITLVSEDNFLLFTPMLPQVASGTIETRLISYGKEIGLSFRNVSNTSKPSITLSFDLISSTILAQ